MKENKCKDITCNTCKKSFVPRYPTGYTRISKYCSRTCYYQSRYNEGNCRWAGDKIQYRGIHNWIVRLLGKPNKCVDCGKIGYGHHMHWANISGRYLRDIEDWMRLCAMCHSKFDAKKKTCQQ